jgi:hypothetical protein
MATTWVMTMTVEAMVAAVVGMAISLRGAEERGRRATHDNQLNDYNAAYDDEAAHDVDENDGDAAYDEDVASGVVIGWTPARLGRQCQQNNGEDASPTTPAQRWQRRHRNAGETRVRRGQRRQCNDGSDAMTAKMPAKQWLRCQRDVGVNASGTPAKTPARCWRRCQCKRTTPEQRR